MRKFVGRIRLWMTDGDSIEELRVNHTVRAWTRERAYHKVRDWVSSRYPETVRSSDTAMYRIRSIGVQTEKEYRRDEDVHIRMIGL